jgi:hypothetical protein
LTVHDKTGYFSSPKQLTAIDEPAVLDRVSQTLTAKPGVPQLGPPAEKDE